MVQNLRANLGMQSNVANRFRFIDFSGIAICRLKIIAAMCDRTADGIGERFPKGR